MSRKDSRLGRVVLWAALPASLVLVASVVTIHTGLKGSVKEGLKESIRLTEKVFLRTSAEDQQRNRQLNMFLREDAGWQAGLSQLRAAGPHPETQLAVRETLEAQLQNLGGAQDYDLVLIADPSGHPVATLVAKEDEKVPLDISLIVVEPSMPILVVEGTLYEATSQPIRLGTEKLGSLIVARKFDTGSLNSLGYTALVSNRRIIRSNLPAGRIADVEQQFRTKCAKEMDGCELRIGSETYWMLPVDRTNLRGRFQLFSLLPLEEAIMDAGGDAYTVFTNGVDSHGPKSEPRL